MAFRFLVIALLYALALGKPALRDLQVHEARSGVPTGFGLSGAGSPDTTLHLRLALVRGDDAGLINALYDVSTPSSANYGQHLTREEVEAFAVPKAETIAAVNAWLSENGISAIPISSAGDWLSIDVSVSQANELLDAEFSIFTHTATGQQFIRTLSYSIPTELVGHLDLVHPTVTFSTPYAGKPVVSEPVHTKRSRSLTERASDCLNDQGYMTPACLQSLYSIPTTPATNSSNGIAVSGYEYEWPLYSDLSTFLQDLRPDMSPSTSYTVVSIDNGTDPQNNTAGLEASLDIQYTVGIATDVPVTFLTVGTEVTNNNDFTTALIDTAAYMLNLSAPPQVITTSYGADEDLVSQNLAYNLCNMLAQLGSRGVSVLYSSGDGGVSGNHWDPDCKGFVPTFPSGCPYVTSVGGTINIPEQAVNFSGGGFSNYWPRPDFQESAVTDYINYLNGANDGLYNASGRGYPDVAAYGQDFEIVVDGEIVGVSGTSCSTPTFASVIALLNDQLLAAGKSTLGWLNPWLYSTAVSALNDVTEGNNFACMDYTTGFNSTTSRDPVTGLGTPDFAKLKTAAGL